MCSCISSRQSCINRFEVKFTILHFIWIFFSSEIYQCSGLVTCLVRVVLCYWYYVIQHNQPHGRAVDD